MTSTTPSTSTTGLQAASTNTTPIASGVSLGKEEKNKKILMQLFTGDLDVASIKKVLRSRNIAFSSGLRKPALAELLRVILEADLSVDDMLQLRSQEMAFIQQGKMRRPIVISRLHSSGDLRDFVTARDQDLRARLWHRLHQDIDALQEQRQIQRQPQQDKENTPRSTPAEKCNSSSILDPAQRERIEDHRKRALELQQQSQAKKPRGSSSPAAKGAHGMSDTGSQSFTTPSRPTRNSATTPVKAAGASIAPTTTNMSSQLNQAQSTKSPFQSPLRKTNTSPTNHSVVTPLPVANPYTRKLSASASHEIPLQEPTCIRCGEAVSGTQADPNTSNLCIVWKHTGELQRERHGPSRWHDTFRWSCCGRLDPQPCFVGRHTTTLDDDEKPPVIQCLCGKPAHLKRTRKVGSPNRGRYFFRCNSLAVGGSGGGHHGVSSMGPCKFFAWADVVLRLPHKEIPKVAPDGVREWECLFANPYRECYSGIVSNVSSCCSQRERLMAALCLQEMCASVDGTRHSTSSATDTETLVESILHLAGESRETRKEEILRRLLPLTPEQATRRFGLLDDTLDGLTKEECQAIVLDFLQKSPLVRSLGVRTTPSCDSRASVDPATHSGFIVDLEGLEAYLRGA